MYSEILSSPPAKDGNFLRVDGVEVSISAPRDWGCSMICVLRIIKLSAVAATLWLGETIQRLQVKPLIWNS